MKHYYHLTQNERLRKFLPVYVNSYANNYEQKLWQYKNGSFVNHVILILSGKGFVEINGQRFYFEAGDIFFFKSDIPVFYGPESETLTTRFFTFNGLACKSLFELYDIPEYKIFKNTRIANLISEFCHLAEKGLSDEVLSAKLYDFLVEFCNSIKGNAQPKSLEIALDYIKKNLFKDISINELCEASLTSRSTLFKHFKNHLGVSPVAYINNLRIDNAKSYLESMPNEPIENIANEVGFTSTSYFIEIFKSITGTTPAKFRKERLG